MYTLAVRRTFIARHALIGGDWGRENFPNSHRFLLELQLGGKELDSHGFLVDILDVEKHLDGLIDRYRDQLLNDLPEFAGLNPSLEHFARILAQGIESRLADPGVSTIRVVLWEDDSAWAAYEVRA
jgi:6-pyruvoyltetrahydropterin/6-carboxytetrahydropterin synthase